MLLSVGTQERLIKETTTQAGQTVREGSIESDALLVGLWVSSISGNMSVDVYTLADDNTAYLEFSYPTQTTPSTELFQRKTGVKFQRFKIVITYDAPCSYEIYVRAISNAGESSSKILGNNAWTTGALTVGTSPLLLIPSAIVDRQGVVVKNWSKLNQNIYIAESGSQASISNAYPLGPNDALAIDIAAGAEVYVVADASGADVRYAQAGG